MMQVPGYLKESEERNLNTTVPVDARSKVDAVLPDDVAARVRGLVMLGAVTWTLHLPKAMVKSIIIYVANTDVHNVVLW